MAEVTNVLGETRQVRMTAPDSYICPFCGYAVVIDPQIGDRECGNPACTANPAMTLETAKVLQAHRAYERSQEEERERVARIRARYG